MSDIVNKWGKKIAERGFAQIPNYLINLNTFVDDDHKLSPTEMVILLQLVSTWWKKDEMPFPSMQRLASRVAISQRQVQRSITSLEKKGFINRKRGKFKGIIASNIYDLGPLVRSLGDIADFYGNDRPRKIRERSSEGEGLDDQALGKE
jgi:hypothetical protein